MKNYEVKLLYDIDSSIEIVVRFSSEISLSVEEMWNMALALLSLPSSDFKLVSAGPI